jgi:predicted TPR repeat methyltransferase
VHLELADQPGVTAVRKTKHTAAARILERIVEVTPNDLAALVRLAFLHARPRGNEANFSLAAKLLEQARAAATELEEGGASARLLQDQVAFAGVVGSHVVETSQ